MKIDKLTLVEAMAQLKEDGSNRAVFGSLEIEKNHEDIRFIICGKESDIFALANENWEIVHKPKFEVGDVAIYDSNKLVFVGEFNRSTDSYDLYDLKDYIGSTNLSCCRDRESELVLLMTASEFEAKLKEALGHAE